MHFWGELFKFLVGFIFLVTLVTAEATGGAAVVTVESTVGAAVVTVVTAEIT